ncbi:histone deacetylase family protein [Methylobacterium haplocladii]|uniref:Acetoin utilization protein n=1 Tax=Methylobacterium haplocladii TaxID=1176176 RepID=A0A512ISK7_9HYPH|nr:histone deacetylase family protein [Methylobacterium haplocladii]GEP00685.1 acetoin utilization protein [Methylobacterium haplocladii]GJD82377.1 Histone deacetylase-like amidohydrolase [Methylobacterium haplocladii]GLS60793.1 acetoin utilization protein [Methylobacterium haplocladii]
MQTLLLAHPAFARHDTGFGHPERPARMEAIGRALAGPAFSDLRREEAPLREDVEAQIRLAHDPAYLDRLKALATDPAALPTHLNPDTVMSAGTWEAALRGVGAGLRAVDAVLDPGSGLRNAFCQVRPCGHHAEHDRAMGFCLFSNVAIAALYARKRHGLERIAVVDFDVHHGNGTQQIFWPDKNLFYGSTHQMPWFPGTGAVSERGVGNIHNAPLKAGDGGAAFRAALGENILPALHAFRPELILVSAGFDAHADDPLGRLRLEAADFAWATRVINDAAHTHCGGRVVSVLEGGYKLDSLAACTAVHVSGLIEGAQ